MIQQRLPCYAQKSDVPPSYFSLKVGRGPGPTLPVRPVGAGGCWGADPPPAPGLMSGDLALALGLTSCQGVIPVVVFWEG